MSGELYALRGLLAAIRRCIPRRPPESRGAALETDPAFGNAALTAPIDAMTVREPPNQADGAPKDFFSLKSKKSKHTRRCSCFITPEEADGKLPNCAICLFEVGYEGPPQTLRCGHAYCRPCIGRHVATTLAENRPPGCPLCKRSLSAAEAQACCPSATNGAARQFWALPGGPPSSSVSAAPSTSALTDAEVLALGMRRCPRCRTPIEKTGGCDNMTCRCGCRFKWSEQPGGGRANRPSARMSRIARTTPAPIFVIGLVGVLPVAYAAGLVMSGAALLAAAGACVAGRFGKKAQVAVGLSLIVLSLLGWLPTVMLGLMGVGGLAGGLGWLVWACRQRQR